MRRPRRDGDRYEKHLEDSLLKVRIRPVLQDDMGVISTHIRVWDKGASTYVTKPLEEESFKRVKGSGSSAEKKGDLKSENYLVQAKRTDKKSFTVKLDDLRKAEREAMNLGKKPLFIVGFYENDRVVDEWVFVPKWTLGEMV